METLSLLSSELATVLFRSDQPLLTSNINTFARDLELAQACSPVCERQRQEDCWEFDIGQ